MNSYYSISEQPNFKALVERGMLMQQEVQNYETIGKNKTLVIVFFSPSLRTRISTHKAGLKLGMQVISMNAGDGYQMEFDFGKVMDGNTAEHIKEAALVLSQFADIIAIRSFPGLISLDEDLKDQVLRGFTKYASVPVVNLESCLHHPCQGLADAITIEANKRGNKPKVVLSWAPHPKALPLAVPISFAQAMTSMDYDFIVTHPEGHELPTELVGNVKIEYDQDKALEGADFVYAKSWSSTVNYGVPNPGNKDWMISGEKMKLTNNGKFMHCLPIRRNVVASDEVLDSENSLIYQQAKNRVYAAQAVLYRLLQ